MEQQPPNESVIAAIHTSARGRDAVRHGAPGFELSHMTGGPGELTDIIVEARSALGRIAATRAVEPTTN